MLVDLPVAGSEDAEAESLRRQQVRHNMDPLTKLSKGNELDSEAEGVLVDLPVAGSEDAEAESLRRQQVRFRTSLIT